MTTANTYTVLSMDLYFYKQHKQRLLDPDPSVTRPHSYFLQFLIQKKNFKNDYSSYSKSTSYTSYFN